MRAHVRALLAQSWHAFHPLPALYCAPAVVGLLAAGLAFGQPGVAILAAGGAFSVGFGAFQRVSRAHFAPMLLAALFMAVATAIGTVASGNSWIDAICVAACGFTLGLGTSFGTGPWWVMLQGAIFLVVAGSMPGDLREGLSRAGLILAGGLVQCAVVWLLRAAFPGGFPPLAPPTAVDPPGSPARWLATARRVLRPGAPEFSHGLLLALAAGAAILLEKRLALPNGYWAPMTVLLVLRRGAGETATRGLLRGGGTLIGAGVATLIVALVRPDAAALVGLAAVSAWACYAVQWVNYGTFSVCVTSYIAFLLSLEGLPEPQVAGRRVVATLLGGAIGLSAFAVARLLRLSRAVVRPAD